ncbi:ribonuclease R [Azospirillum sp. RWY-5-1]|uniref:Ribonuclease R n=1 Tax=Azospirillum oleiclasticum TaxID=2735135 RepID=A0ABX2T3C5_9PROT|nr:ribonuclease R [Azospirillum oleiclasticum]NYZ11406.1 ribonuclease R [Azospirillum oleiclasticum]NYZ18567.1 ribonuclease R [Azospirillum oleiclasticum]
MAPRLPAPFPTKEAVLAFIRNSPVPVGKREVARAFKLSGSADRERLKLLMKELEAEGTVERGHGRRVAPPAALPEVAALEVSAIDLDGELSARPLVWTGDGEPPRIFLVPERSGLSALGIGDRLLARLSRINDRLYEARFIRRIEGSVGRILGVYRVSAEGGRIVPTDRRNRTEFVVLPANDGDAEPGELVLADVLPATRLGLPQARVVERLGSTAEPRAVSLIAIHGQGLPTVFDPAALRQAERATIPPLQDRIDLRPIPLVTIDGADARDFDDAVWAEPDTDPTNPGGWHLIVAIADVAWYVRAGSALDLAARGRGNSVYFPDRVVPMLPEALSNGLCSLRPGEDRACLGFHLWVGRDGRPRRHAVFRGLMRSAARLTYEQLQAAQDGFPDETTASLTEPVIAPLYGAFRSLWQARQRRGTLDLDIPERKIRLDEAGRVAEIAPRQRLDSHKLIEEFMIAANVAAAETLEAKGAPCLYRVHDQPSMDKMEALRDFLHGLGYPLPKGQALKPDQFTRILTMAEGRPESALVSEIILRSQAQAAYAPDNIGHFGLALARYAHFTSPIRRYADLVVHRSLIRACGLGEGGLDDAEAARLNDTGEHVSKTERRSAAAERDAVDRYTAAFLADRVGATFSGRISGVSRFGLFVRLDESGADGLVPASTLPDDQYEHDEAGHALVGRREGRVFRLAAPVKVELAEADPLTGSTLFRLLTAEGAEITGIGGRTPASRHSGGGPKRGRGRAATSR